MKITKFIILGLLVYIPGVVFSKNVTSKRKPTSAALSQQKRCHDVKPIDHATTINKPGYYCLINNIKGVISIKSSDVVLFLNDKTISGDMQGILIDSANNVQILGGSIENFKDTAVSVQNSKNVTISDLNVSSGPTAFAFKQGEHISVQNCAVTKCTFRMIEAQNIKNSIFSYNTFLGNTIDAGIRLLSCSSTHLLNNVINNNQGILGLIAICFDQCSGCICNGACINDNEQCVAGIKSANSRGTIVKKSLVYNNSMKSISANLFEGILMAGDQGDLIKNNIVEYNTISGNVDAVCVGMSVKSSTVNNLAVPTRQSLIKRNIAKYNTGVLRSIGFYNATTGNDNAFFNNLAQGHTENFMFFPVTYPIAIFNSSFGSFNHAPGNLDNLSISH